MITLCIETTTARIGIAVTEDGKLLAETLIDASAGHQNNLLVPEIKHLLNKKGLTVQQIDLFACAAGPGSFTGVRTGIATIQGLAFATGKPCVTVSTLAMLSMNIPVSDIPVCPMLDARKSEIYTAIYLISDLPVAIRPDFAISPDRFLDELTAPTIFLGDGAIRYQDLIKSRLGNNAIFAPLIFNAPRPSAGCLIAEYSHLNGESVTPELLKPAYHRLSEAEISRQKKI